MRKFLDEVNEKLSGKPYHIVENNCYHSVIEMLRLLKKDIPYEPYLKEIHDEKDKQYFRYFN